MFDPFFYISSQHQQTAKQLYEKNNYSTKLVPMGLNDIVGDYTSPDTFATALNHQVIENLAKSSLLAFLVPLVALPLKHFEAEREEVAKSK